MKISELREKSIEELYDQLVAVRKSYFSLRMQLATQQLTKIDQISKTRKSIARIKTVMSEKGGVVV